MSEEPVITDELESLLNVEFGPEVYDIEQGMVSAKPSLERAMRIRNDFLTLLLDVRDTLDTLLEETAGSAGMVVS